MRDERGREGGQDENIKERRMRKEDKKGGDKEDKNMK